MQEVPGGEIGPPAHPLQARQAQQPLHRLHQGTSIKRCDTIRLITAVGIMSISDILRVVVIFVLKTEQDYGKKEDIQEKVRNFLKDCIEGLSS